MEFQFLAKQISEEIPEEHLWRAMCGDLLDLLDVVGCISKFLARAMSRTSTILEQRLANV